MEMLGKKLKEKLRRKEVVLGIGLEELGTPIIARLMAKAGFDWVHLEMEHNLLNPETMYNLINMANAADLPVIVKAPELSRNWVSRTMDAGASGIRLPWVESKEEVKRLVEWIKYPSEGKRAVYLGANADFQETSPAEYIREANESTLVFPHVETRKGVENIEDIVSVDDVDVVIVGPYDLSISLGVPGQFRNKKLLSAIDKIIEACERHGVTPGITVESVASAKGWVEKGMRCIECSTDRGILYEGAKSLVKEFREYMKGRQTTKRHH